MTRTTRSKTGLPIATTTDVDGSWAGLSPEAVERGMNASEWAAEVARQAKRWDEAIATGMSYADAAIYSEAG